MHRPIAKDRPWFSQRLCSMGPFKYYVTKEVGGWPIADVCWQGGWVGGGGQMLTWAKKISNWKKVFFAYTEIFLPFLLFFPELFYDLFFKHGLEKTYIGGWVGGHSMTTWTRRGDWGSIKSLTSADKVGGSKKLRTHVDVVLEWTLCISKNLKVLKSSDLTRMIFYLKRA